MTTVPPWHSLEFSGGNRPPRSTNGYGRYCLRIRSDGNPDMYTPWETVRISPLLIPFPPVKDGVQVRFLWEPAIGVIATSENLPLT